VPVQLINRLIFYVTKCQVLSKTLKLLPIKIRTKSANTLRYQIMLDVVAQMCECKIALNVKK